MFTQSRFEGPSVTLSRPRAASGRARAVVVIAKNANVATGAQGSGTPRRSRQPWRPRVGIPADEVLIASTGVIGRPYPMDLLRSPPGRACPGPRSTPTPGRSPGP